MADSDLDENFQDDAWHIVQDVLKRRQRGERVTREEILRRYPSQADDIGLFLDRAARVSAARSSTPFFADGDQASLPRRFANYELIEVISRGGMGTVYRAIQNSTNREVDGSDVAPV